jgi:hypothetical protein
MRRYPLLPCPQCMGSLAEEGLLYAGGKVVAREVASRLQSVLKGAPLGVQYLCTRCGAPQVTVFRRPAAG